MENASPKYHVIFIIFIYLVMEETPTSSTDLEENNEDELATDTSTWSNKERKKLQHMTEFHEEYQ